MIISNAAFAQGSTSARMSGSVISEGEPLPGATVIATHEPTGSKFGAITNAQGYFTINNMNVGGPYKVTASYIGYQETAQGGIQLTLGQTFQINFELKEGSTELQEVVVTSTASSIFDGNRTGAETFVNKRKLNSLPTVERNLNDYMRLTPQSSVQPNGGISFGGMNNRYNSIFIDGAVNNDVFGLANSGTNGGQAGISPISIDALEQIQVVLAPYDVTLGGFAGGGVNAVTRSGTNEFEGSAYYFVRNEGLSGKTPTDDPNRERTKLEPFSAKTYGARLGGPIIKNKLFFFANVELLREEEPRPFSFSNYDGNATEADINNLITFLDTAYNYNPGGYLNNVQTRNSDKFLLKLDWNINDKHKLSARHSYVKGETDIVNRPNSRNIYFFNTGYYFPTTTNSTAIELKSNFSNKISNNLIIGITSVDDDRDISGDPFPLAVISDGNATINVGTDNFSYSNIVKQNVFTLTDNVSIFKGKHTLTFGTHNEFFKMENLFTIFSTPRYSYGSLGSFMAKDPGFFLFGHEQLAEGQSEIRLGDNAENLGPSFNALQLAFYAQDEIQMNDKFKLTIGLRADIPIFLDNPPLNNTQFNEETVPLIEAEGWNLKGARASQAPKTQVLWSPRVGFNWDVKGDKTTQVRGGIGVFTSRVPWVWPGGMFIRNGLNSNFVLGVKPFYPTPEEWKENLADVSNSPTGDVDLFVEDFKYPQILRGNIAVDQQLPWGLIGTAEFMYSKTLNNIDVKNVNRKIEPAGYLEGTDNRPFFDNGDLIDPTYAYITLVDNTSEGFTWNGTVSLTKPFENGFTGSLAYSYTASESLFDGQGFINSTNWKEQYNVYGRNNPMSGKSIYATGSRITGYASYRLDYADHFATTFSVFYNGQSGRPFSYTYRDVAGNGGPTYEEAEDFQLIYVPINRGEINLIDQVDDGGNVLATAEEQWAALDAYISADDYLSSRRGQYAERNQNRTPFEHIFDVRVLQDFYITTNGSKKHTLQLSLDVFNFGNFLNKDWGRRYFVDSDNYQLITFQGYVPGTRNPQYTFSEDGTPWDIIETGINSARWSAQLGARYSF
ncbi:TonB-dependent receptor [Flammeovirgaceae bacterium SG7u.111]|nr:TonB-dependent receptor [Flammeovirgaceae bacterium SG7u.132]WPO35937.1 TonB-dependent receptor [Flammeovirgaceae bacterium SG7u.111]